MALTNEQIEAQNFKDFYQQIKPFLNPNNAVINNNRFSWRDIYTNGETSVIGQWTDGKPIYQTVVVTTSPTTAYTWTRVVQLGSGKNIIDAKLLLTLQNGVTLPLTWSDVAVYLLNSSGDDTSPEAGSVSVMVKDLSCLSCTLVCTIQYTKTGDSNLPLGVRDDYKTTARIVGSWIDGRAIYQKTYSVNKSLSSVNVWTQINCPHGLTGVDKVITLTGTWYDSTNSQYGTVPMMFNNDALMLYFDSTNIVILYVGAGWLTTVVDSITIEYLVVDSNS